MMVLSAACTWSQGGSRGSVAISVTDSGDSLVSGAKLTLVDQKTKDTRTAVTLEKGNYVFSGLLGGTYALTIEKDGFQTQNFTSVLVLTARTTDITVKLTVGRTTENVTVQAESSPLVESTSNAIGSNLDVKQIEDLPLSDRRLGRHLQRHARRIANQHDRRRCRQFEPHERLLQRLSGGRSAH
jgi:hypothetical protein